MQRDHLHNLIVREIIARVASGTYAVGRRLPAERVLCEEFHVARGTLRKALSMLEELGVVQIKANSGVYVRGVTHTELPQTFLPPDFKRVDLDDIIVARKAIELAALRQAVGRIAPRDLRALRGLLQRMASAVDDLPAFLELDLTFHQSLVRASGNAVLATAFEAIYDYHRFSAVYTSQQEGEEARALRHHERLLAAIEAEDVGTACRVLDRHLDSIKRYGRMAKGKRRASATHGAD
ncbi:MAG TPA: FCD domain-containing protein [Phycisphaerae bacterium]|nr:FCD domain-containing protein [Phycisphaerae bacterium]HOJ72611.1 FCD domain-containing protein [Phycisphaerae bacterium]HOM49728.1 FCD domain-containing protein [Phycisphaerae bacterium]HON64980.1 FCD domain-containing protein [Phycisphaerae bacterium]HOQ84827.1 FCD domain-containing protein [Phycisphaerae bacterium]